MKAIYRFFTLTVAYLLTCSALQAGEQVSHSLYKVTTYNLGTSIDFQEFSPVNYHDQFDPLLITNSQADILSPEQFNDPRFESSMNKSAANGFAIAAQYSPTSKIALQGVMGITKNNWDPNTAKHESSWEANLSVIYKMFHNFSYEVHFGYMDTGDLFKERNSYKDVESIIMISNQLTMSF